MCGIAGEVRADGHVADVGLVSRMCDHLSPRGPDAAGVFGQGNVAFGHRRLKIIDLSECAQQPMVDSDLGLAIVFNGCIYNYRELRDQLKSRGYRFFSNGDTEVILKAFHAWGPNCVKRFSGMFVFAIWERDRNTITLARDRLGIKPLYYAQTDGAFRFASSLPALLTGGDIDTTVDPVALNFYMNFHAVVPPPRTILNGVKKLPPATIMRISAGHAPQFQKYWYVDYVEDDADSNLQEDEWQERIIDALTRAVQRRLEADVPVGVLLSGGVDSSLIVGLLRRLGHDDVETFSVGFETVGNERGNEFEYSDIVAETFDTKHHKIQVDSTQRLLPALPGCVAAMSEPMVSHDNIGFYLLSEEVSKHVKVVQSGQGADEVFGGYHWYPPLLESRYPTNDYARLFRDRDDREFRLAVRPEFHGEDWAQQFIVEQFAAPGAEEAVSKALRLDTHVMLVDDPVKRVDNMTMAWGLEARVPFLDHDLVELAARVPWRLKVRNGGKYVLKEAAREVVPNTVIDRPKGYFPVPALKYLKGAVLELVCDTLRSQASQERGIFNPGYVETLIDDPEAHITPLRGSKLWQVALLEMWMQTHVN